MAKRRGATARDPKYTTQPVKGGVEQVAGATRKRGGVENIARDTGDMLTGNKSPEQIARAATRAANRAPVERLSPGVYRSASGGLVTQQGRPIQRQPQQGMAQQIAGGMQQDSMVGQIAGQQANKPYQMGGQYNPDLQQTTASAQQLIGQMGQGNFDASTIGKTPPGYFQGQIQDAMYRVPNLPQMPQASANMGGQYRLSPGVYGTREQAMNQYNQQMQQMYQPMVMPQVRRG